MYRDQAIDLFLLLSCSARIFTTRGINFAGSSTIVERNDIRGQKKTRKRSGRKLQAKSFQGWRQAGELSLDEPGVAGNGSYDIINFL